MTEGCSLDHVDVDLSSCFGVRGEETLSGSPRDLRYFEYDGSVPELKDAKRAA